MYSDCAITSKRTNAAATAIRSFVVRRRGRDFDGAFCRVSLLKENDTCKDYYGPLLLWGHVLLRPGRSFAKKEHLKLFHDYFLIFAPGRI
jgi:hypothetical protein